MLASAQFGQLLMTMEAQNQKRLNHGLLIDIRRGRRRKEHACLRCGLGQLTNRHLCTQRPHFALQGPATPLLCNFQECLWEERGDKRVISDKQCEPGSASIVLPYKLSSRM